MHDQSGCNLSTVKMRPLRIRLVPLVVVFALCALLLSLVAPATSQLSAYSETRSFRDALDGRSMEDAISGPVDKDTSSYGDRTGSTGDSTLSTGTNSPAASSAMSPPGSAGYGSGESGGQMMVNIPANGNLNPQQQQTQIPTAGDEQQKSPPGSSDVGELEREAVPINGGDFPMDPTQRQMMEMKAKQMVAKQMMASMMAGRSGRLSVGATPAAMLEMMKLKMSAQMMADVNRNKMALMTRMQTMDRSGRLQKGEGEMAGGQMYGGDSGSEDADPTPQQMDKGQKAPRSSSANSENGSNGYRRKLVKSENGYDTTTSSPMAGGGYGGDDQQSTGKSYGGADGQQQQDYDQQQQQMMMLAKLQDMSKGMMRSSGYSAKQKMMLMAGGQGGTLAPMSNNNDYKKQPAQSSMAQSMMMSLANKAAYMANMQKQAGSQMSQHQMAPPAVMTVPNQQYGSGSGLTMIDNGANYAGANANGQMAPRRANGYQSSGMDVGAMRALRRASQRRAEKKISPAMMNAMLNKLLGSRGSGEQTDAQAIGSYGGANGNSAAAAIKPLMQAAMLMNGKQPAGMMSSEMLAKLMMMNGAGASQSQKYKQMMMAAMQQQQMQMNGEDQQPMLMDQNQNGAANYGDRSASPMMMSRFMNSMMKARGAAGMDGRSMESSTPSSYSSGTADPSTMAPAAMSYGNGMQAQMGGASNGYSDQQTQKSDMNDLGAGTKGMSAQQQQQSSTMKAYSGASNGMMQQAAPMMNSMRMTPKMSYGGQSSGPAAASGKMSMAQMMRMKMAAKQTYDAAASGADDLQQQQMDMDINSKQQMGATKSYGSADEQQQQQKQDEMPTMSYGRAGQSQAGIKSTAQGPAASEGTKGGPSMLMSRPSMSMSYGEQDNSRDAKEQQQEREDQYGAAPMGQAEPFAFDYKVEDEATGNNQYRKEESDKNGVVRGSYGYMDSNSGVYRHVEYIADENGFRANIKSNEPGLSDGSSNGSGNGPNGADGTKGGQQQSGGSMDGTKSSSGSNGNADYGQQSPAMTPAVAAPPSSSSSLAGPSPSIAQQDTQLPMTPLIDMQQMQMQAPVQEQEPIQQLGQKQMSPAGYASQQQQQQQAGSGMEK